jgi:hypothetical protein
MTIETGNDLKRARKQLGWTINYMVDALRLSPDNGGRTIRRMEAGQQNLTGPICVAVEAFLAGFIPETPDYD